MRNFIGTNAENREDSLNAFGAIQPLIQKQIDDTLREQARASQFSKPPIPVHAHTGTDASQVDYANLFGVEQHSIIRRVTLSSAQILALNTTPVTVVPAYGPKSVVIFDCVDAKLNYGGTAYTGANGIVFKYTDASGTTVSFTISSLWLNSSADTYVHTASVTNITTTANAPLVVHVGTANPATGNSTITMVIKYRVVSFA